MMVVANKKLSAPNEWNRENILNQQAIMPTSIILLQELFLC